MVRQQVLQEEGEEVAVEVAVKDLQPNSGSEEATRAGGEPGQEQPLSSCPSKWNMPEQNQNQVAYLMLLKVRRNDKIVIRTIKSLFLFH